MALDPNIILGFKQPEIQNPMDVAAKALTMRQLSGQVKAQDQTMADDQAVRQAMGANTSIGANGLPNVNTAGVLGGVAGKVGLKSYQDLTTSLQSMDMAQKKQMAQQTTSLVDYAHENPKMYPQIRQQLVASAIDPKLADANLPPDYNDQTAQILDQIKQHAAEHTMDPKDQLEFGAKQQTIKIAQQNADANTKKADAMAARTGQLGSEHADALKDKLAKNFGQDMDPSGPRAGAFGKSLLKKNSAESIDALFQQYPDGNVPLSATTELATAVAGLIGNGSPQSQHQIDTLTPSSMRGDAQKIAGWLTNNPVGMQQQAFMKNLADTAAREKQVAVDQIKSVQVQRLSRHGVLKSKYPDVYQQEMEDAGLSPQDLQKYSKKPGQQSPSGQTVKMLDPKGNIREVPTDQVDAAKAAGGKVYGG